MSELDEGRISDEVLSRFGAHADAILNDEAGEAEVESGRGGDGPGGEAPDDAGDDGATPDDPEARDAAEGEVGDEDAGAGEGEGADDGEQETETYTVKVDGQEVEVTLDELKRSYSRDGDYRQKTARLSDDRKAFDQDKTAFAKRSENLANFVGFLQSLQAFQPPHSDEDLARLEQESPSEWSVALARNTQHQQRIDKAFREFQDHRAEAAKAERAEAVRRLPEAIPDWADREKARADLGALKEHYVSDGPLGFTEDEFNGMVDPRVWAMARDAYRWRTQGKAKAEVARKKVQDAPRLQKPSGRGPTRRAGDKAKLAERRQQLKKTGSVRDAASVFERYLD